MKKTISAALALMLAFSIPVSGLAAASTHKKLYNTQKYQSNGVSYSTAAVKLNKKASDGKEYIRADVTYPKINGSSDIVAAFNAKNKEYARKVADEFIKTYTKEAKAYNDKEGKFRSVKSDPEYMLQTTYSMKYNSNSVVSILYTTTKTVAGVSEVDVRSQNFDLLTGKQLTVDNVSLIPTKGETMQLALKKFNSKIKNNKRIYNQVTLKATDVDYYFDNKKIVFFVDPGVIADESRGMISYELTDVDVRSYLENKVK